MNAPAVMHVEFWNVVCEMVAARIVLRHTQYPPNPYMWSWETRLNAMAFKVRT